MNGAVPSVKIVFAGTKDCGKTTLLSAISINNTDGTTVGPDSFFPTESKEGDATRLFIAQANICLRGIEPRSTNRDPWFSATTQDKPNEIWLEITKENKKHRMFISDFAGETFADAYGIEKKQNEVVEKFNRKIQDACLVFIVISCKDIIGHLKNPCVKMAFAYGKMLAKVKELQQLKPNVEFALIVTQCDQYKALFCTKKKLIEDGIKALTGSNIGAEFKNLRIIYTSSAYQTELKILCSFDGNSKKYKFCPTPIGRRDKNTRSSLGINEVLSLMIATSDGVINSWRNDNALIDEVEKFANNNKDKLGHAYNELMIMIGAFKEVSIGNDRLLKREQLCDKYKEAKAIVEEYNSMTWIKRKWVLCKKRIASRWSGLESRSDPDKDSLYTSDSHRRIDHARWIDNDMNCWLFFLGVVGIVVFLLLFFIKSIFGFDILALLAT